MSAVFICTLGAAPQVVTLVLDTLIYQQVPITRVEVLHTHAEHEPACSSLKKLQQTFLEQRDYDPQILFIPQLLTNKNGPLTDVVTPQEIDGAFQTIYTIIRQHKQAGRQVHLCIAGGRKTMALFSMAAAQILFDGDDRLWHFVSPPDLLKSGAMHANHPDDIVLIPIPITAWGAFNEFSENRARAFLNILTPAERDIVLLLVREGLSNALLADRLEKSAKTVANQLSEIYRKLQQHYALPRSPDRTMLLTLLGRYSQMD